MKKLGFITILLGLCFNAFALETDYQKLAAETQAISKEIAKLIITEKQPCLCRAIFTKASAEIFTGANLIKFKSVKYAKKAIETSLISLTKTTGKNCLDMPVVLKAEADLLAIDVQL
jgi:hypothetical protein